MFGGHRAGKHGWGAAGKVIVLGIIQRDGVMRAFPVKGRGRATIEALVVEHTRPASLYYTDDWQAYAGLAVRDEHVVVRKERGRPRGRDTSTGSKASGVMPSIGPITTGACRKSSSIFARFACAARTREAARTGRRFGCGLPNGHKKKPARGTRITRAGFEYSNGRPAALCGVGRPLGEVGVYLVVLLSRQVDVSCQPRRVPDVVVT